MNKSKWVDKKTRTLNGGVEMVSGHSTRKNCLLFHNFPYLKREYHNEFVCKL